MWHNTLEKHDYQILESYWLNYPKLVKEKNENSMKNHSTKNITSAIETLYNGSDGLMRDFIETGYFDSNVKVIDSKNIADQLITSRFKVARLREGLMEDTAKLIGWV